MTVLIVKMADKPIYLSYIDTTAYLLRFKNNLVCFLTKSGKNNRNPYHWLGGKTTIIHQENEKDI